MPDIAKVPKIDIEVFKGRDKRLTVTIRDEKNVIIDLTGATIEYAIAKTASSKVILISLSVGSGITVTTPTNGIAQIDIPDTGTDALPVGKYFHECVVTDAALRESTVFYGDVDLKPTILGT